MNSYTIEYDSHSMFLRQKSNEKLKDRLDHIRNRRNVFLPLIKETKVKQKSVISDSPIKKHVSIMDLGKFSI